MFPWEHASELEVVRCVVYFCLEWLFRSGWLSHRSVRSRDWGHLWNPPPPTSTNTVQPTGTESICMLCRTPWATKQSHWLHFHIQMVCWFHPFLVRVFSLSLVGQRSLSDVEDGSQSGEKPYDLSHPEERELNSPARCLFTQV